MLEYSHYFKKRSRKVLVYGPNVDFLIHLSSPSPIPPLIPNNYPRPVFTHLSSPQITSSFFWFHSPSSSLFPRFIKWGGETEGSITLGLGLSQL